MNEQDVCRISVRRTTARLAQRAVEDEVAQVTPWVQRLFYLLLAHTDVLEPADQVNNVNLRLFELSKVLIALSKASYFVAWSCNVVVNDRCKAVMGIGRIVARLVRLSLAAKASSLAYADMDHDVVCVTATFFWPRMTHVGIPFGIRLAMLAAKLLVQSLIMPKVGGGGNGS